MKKIFLLSVLLNMILLLAGCGSDESASHAETLSFAESLSPEVYTCLADEWAAWNAMDRSKQMFSSHMPGLCSQSFDNWDALETFLGFPVSNPLEEDSRLEKANCIGMPDCQENPRFLLTIQGTEDGHVELINIETGYRVDDIRVMFWIAIYDDSPEQLESLKDSYNSEPQIIATSGEKFYANEIRVPDGNRLYLLNIVGAPEKQAQVQSVMNQILEAAGF